MRSERIEKTLNSKFSPIHFLEIIDESHQHAGRAGQESHFKVFLVSDTFTGQSRVQRQRSVHECLNQEFEQGLHALSLRVMTESEYSKQKAKFESPDCQGANKP